MDRQKKLKELEDRQKKADKSIADDRQAFISALQEKIDQFKEVLGLGVDVKNTDELIIELKKIEALAPAVEKLELAISKIKAPDYPKTVKLENIPKIVSEKVDLKPLGDITKRLDSLTKEISKIKAPKQGQAPGDYIPMRRVMKVGNELMYDDSFYTGGGGGGTNIPTVNGSVPVVNPDGSNISGAGGGLTDAELRATPVDVALSSDIEIGAVELKNGSDDTRATVTAANALKVDGSAVTQPVSAASLPLPSGAATAALQTQPGVDIGDVTINNAAGGSAVNVQDGGNSLTVDYATTGSGTATGALRVELPTNGTGLVGLNAGTNNIGDVDVLTVPTDPFGANADAASATGSISAKLRFIASTGIPITGTVTVGSHAVTNAGTFAVQNSALATATGATIHKTDALVATAVAVKASAGNLYGYHIFNPNSTDIYVQFYNIAQGSVTVGSSTRAQSFLCPGGGVLDATLTVPVSFSTAITIAATTTLTGNTAPSTGLLTNIWYA